MAHLSISVQVVGIAWPYSFGPGFREALERLDRAVASFLPRHRAGSHLKNKRLSTGQVFCWKIAHETEKVTEKYPKKGPWAQILNFVLWHRFPS